MPVQTRLQKKLLEFQSLNTNKIDHQNPSDFQALINPTLSNNMAFQSAVNQPNQWLSHSGVFAIVIYPLKVVY